MGRYSLFDPAIVLFKTLSRQPLRGSPLLFRIAGQGCCRAAPFDSGAFAVVIGPGALAKTSKGVSYERGRRRSARASK
jgi:hypothetical protein